MMKHKVELKPGAVPFKEGTRRMTLLNTEKANKEVRELIRLGLIQPSYSPWANGIVMAAKKGNQLRMCCDFRQWNAQTVKDALRLPRVDECFARLGSARYVTALDLASAF